VSWGAVIGGAFAGTALSVILLALGAGLGLSSVSPWSNEGASASAVGTATIIWLIVMQIAASGLGGYLAGRLRTKWVNVHTDEVFFRDTAHGFLVWAVAMVITASFLTSAATSMVGGAAKASATVLSKAGGAAAAAGVATANPAEGSALDTIGYFVDPLFRSDMPKPDVNDAMVRAETGRILVNGLRQKDMPPADKTYLAKLVAAKTGLSQADAEKRVDDVIAQARRAAEDVKQAADAARKAAAHLSLWTFLALLIGAFCASYAATIGGRQRDQVRV
jgi:hypothetical protein